MRQHGWLDATTPRPKPVAMSTVGQVREHQAGKKMPLSSLGLDRARHATCVDHVEVPGLREPVCIRRGDDVETIVAEARELAGGAR